MSYHRARTLPQVQPMRNLAAAYGPYAQQVRYVIPPPPRRHAPQQIWPAPAPRPLGNSGDGLGSTLVVL